jgi:glucose/arabinose dehydrogenase
MNVVVRYRITRDASTGNYSAASTSREMVLEGIPTNSMYHNGGHVVLDAQGNLMISTGDAQVQANAQSLTSLSGKVLRIRPNASSPGYTIPPGNPFANDASRRREIWCWGLRNSWSMDQEQHTSRSYIGDVGSSSWEEINDGTTPANFGWPTHEGFASSSSLQNYRNPVYTYAHGSGRASITGPVFYHYHGFKFPTRFEGAAIFSDYVNGWIKCLLRDNRTVETMIDTGLRYPEGPICLAVWEGEVYFIALDESIKK